MSKHLFQSRVLRVAGAAALALVLSGCGPEFDPPSKLQSLRILAVKKDQPYLTPPATPDAATQPTLTDPSADYPGSPAHLTLALEDARRKEDKLNHLQKIWFGGCNNPFNDNYFTCLANIWLSFKLFNDLGTGPDGLNDGEVWSIRKNYSEIGYTRIMEFIRNSLPPRYGELLDSADPNATVDGMTLTDLLGYVSALTVGAGDAFDYKVPSWVIETHPRAADPDIPRYGLSQVFLAVCDGEIGIAPDWQGVVDPLEVLSDATRGFPLSCYEPNTSKERGPDNFMVSYSNLYVYDEIANKNPVIAGFTFNGDTVDASAVCLGADCVGMVEPSCDADAPTPRAQLCHPGGASDCKELGITPILVQKDNQEVDELASRVGGGTSRLYEQMWIRYYADTGDIKNDAKRLQDATEGWFAEHDTKWTAPNTGKAGDVAHIWAVVYDNRGGVDWARVSVCLED